MRAKKERNSYTGVGLVEKGFSDFEGEHLHMAKNKRFVVYYSGATYSPNNTSVSNSIAGNFYDPGDTLSIEVDMKNKIFIVSNERGKHKTIKVEGFSNSRYLAFITSPGPPGGKPSQFTVTEEW